MTDGKKKVVDRDFNKDGKLDLASTSHTAGVVQIHLGIGNGTFMAPVNYPVGTTPIGLVAVDLNKDGNLDLVATDFGADTISILDGTATGTFAAARNVAVVSPHSLASADLNNDGNPDVIAVNNVNTGTVFLGNGMGMLAQTSTITLNSGSTFLATGDLNGDNEDRLRVQQWQR